MVVVVSNDGDECDGDDECEKNDDGAFSVTLARTVAGWGCGDDDNDDDDDDDGGLNDRY